MRRLSNLVRVRVLLLLLLLFVAGCFPESRLSLSDPDKAKADERLVGKWQIADGKGHVLHMVISKVNRKDVPAGILEAKFYDETGGPQEPKLCLFTTSIDKAQYANIFDGEVLDREKHPRWDPANVKSYMLCKYQVEKDKLTIRFLDDEACEKAIDKGKIKGTIKERKFTSGKDIVFIDSRENLIQLIAKEGEKIWSPKTTEYQRTK
jgi:hypothetical protein